MCVPEELSNHEASASGLRVLLCFGNLSFIFLYLKYSTWKYIKSFFFLRLGSKHIIYNYKVDKDLYTVYCEL